MVKVRLQAASILLIGAALSFLSACGTTDKARLKESRAAFVQGDFKASEASLYTPEVFKQSENRLEHFYFLSSIAMAEGSFEKAAFFLNKARDIAKSVRSESGLFEWFSKDYRSNPIEYSYLHSMLVMSYTLLAEAGKTDAWSTPEIKDDKGNMLVAGQSFPARVYSAREVAEYRQKAHAELLAWDTHLETLKEAYPTDPYYKEDLWARALASYLHGVSSDRNERRTSELLVTQLSKILTKEFSRYPSASSQAASVDTLLTHLKDHSKRKGDSLSSLFVCEAGVMSKYKIQRFHLGLSTLFGQIQDPGLRMLMERIGIQVIMNEAPEFGLVLFSGAIAGAISGGTNDEDSEEEGPPRFFTDAVDRSFGFEIRFPTLRFPSASTEVTLHLSKVGSAPDASSISSFKLPIVSPLQEMVATELHEREGKEMFARAVKIGAQYLAVLLPAIQAYKSADKDGNAFKKLAVLAGFYMAKKAIDAANEPDLRSWSMLPKILAADLIPVRAGEYLGKLQFKNQYGTEERDLGTMAFGNAAAPVIWKRIGELQILKKETLEPLK